MNIELYNMNQNGIAYCEAKGLSKCFTAYAENCPGEEIMEVGFNPSSGYVYIALENGISIASAMGTSVEYIVMNPEDGEEIFFDSYQAALDHDWQDATTED